MLQSDGSLIAPVRQETDSVSSLLLAEQVQAQTGRVIISVVNRNRKALQLR